MKPWCCAMWCEKRQLDGISRSDDFTSPSRRISQMEVSVLHDY